MAQTSSPPRSSRLAQQLGGSEILRIAGQIRTLRERGDTICNLTVGDFAPSEFPIPRELGEYIRDAVARGETNYPPQDGIPGLRAAVRTLYRDDLGLDYPVESVLITSGARPGIYGAFRAVVDPGDRVVYGVPSWNNHHYCTLVGATAVPVAGSAENAFFPTAAELAPALRGARLLVINSPSNPTGTVITAEALSAICDAVLEENRRREGQDRPLFLLYDQVYRMLTFGGLAHVDPVTLRPAMRPYTIYVDALSKAFAATGLRVGWVVAPEDIAKPMSNLFAHAGTWAPRPEQVAAARFLGERAAIATYRDQILAGLKQRLDALFTGIMALRARGLPVTAIEPMGAIYLSARFAANGMRSPDGAVLRTNEEIRAYLLQAAGFGVIPFQAFALEEDTGWFRLSVGAVSLAEIEQVMPRVGEALERLVTG